MYPGMTAKIISRMVSEAENAVMDSSLEDISGTTSHSPSTTTATSGYGTGNDTSCNDTQLQLAASMCGIENCLLEQNPEFLQRLKKLFSVVKTLDEDQLVESCVTKLACNNKNKSLSSKDNFKLKLISQSRSNINQNNMKIESNECVKLRFKTEFCKNIRDNGYCRFGSECHFAHDLYELRPRSIDSRYKTIRCQSFHGPASSCQYADRCDYIHGETEEDLKSLRHYMELYRMYSKKLGVPVNGRNSKKEDTVYPSLAELKSLVLGKMK